MQLLLGINAFKGTFNVILDFFLIDRHIKYSQNLKSISSPMNGLHGKLLSVHFSNSLLFSATENFIMEFT